MAGQWIGVAVVSQLRCLGGTSAELVGVCFGYLWHSMDFGAARLAAALGRRFALDTDGIG